MSDIKQIYKLYFIGVICAIIGIGGAYGVCELVDKVIVPNASPNTQLVVALLLLVVVGAIVIYLIYKLSEYEQH
jgi:hypothetical protein